jgi:agmatine/peptidylarginine deiminase
MKIKPVYSIRVGKNDDWLRDYLEQFPVSEQTQALKEAIKYGIEALKKDYETNQVVQELKKQDEKINQIIEILKNGNFQSDDRSHIEEDEDQNIDPQIAKETLKEGLSMFLG